MRKLPRRSGRPLQSNFDLLGIFCVRLNVDSRAFSIAGLCTVLILDRLASMIDNPREECDMLEGFSPGMSGYSVVPEQDYTESSSEGTT